MPLVGNVIFGEDSFGICQAKEYSKLVGKGIEPTPEITLVFKGSDLSKIDPIGHLEGLGTPKGE